MHGSSSPRLLYALITYNIATDAAVNTSYGLEAHIIEDLHFVMLNTLCIIAVAYSGILFFGKGGVQQIQLRTEDGENGDLGAAAP